jgi:hypothetical protein
VPSKGLSWDSKGLEDVIPGAQADMILFQRRKSSNKEIHNRILPITKLNFDF